MKSNAVVDVGNNNNNKSIDEEPRRILAGTDNNVINLAQILNGSSSAPDGQSSATIQIVQGIYLFEVCKIFSDFVSRLTSFYTLISRCFSRLISIISYRYVGDFFFFFF